MLYERPCAVAGRLELLSSGPLHGTAILSPAAAAYGACAAASTSCHLSADCDIS